MTQARKLKKTIRARSRKTGESYAAARRQVLQHKARAATPARSVTVATRPTDESELPALLLKSQPRLVEKTGHGWAHWFAVLDAFGVKEQGHTASARHVAEDHGVDGWHAQEITVQYERTRGLRAANQRMSGEYEVSISKSLPAEVGAVVKALRDSRSRKTWMAELAPELRRAFETALGGANGLRERGKGAATLRFKTEAGVTVALYLDPKPNGRSLLVAQNMKLRAQSDVARLRAAWKPAFEALARQLGG